jgi:hypothetical protein
MQAVDLLIFVNPPAGGLGVIYDNKKSVVAY